MSQESPVPIKPLETERLRLRRFRPDDWEAIYAYASDAATNFYLREGEITEEELRAWVTTQSVDEEVAYAVVVKPDDAPIGHLIFRPEPIPCTYEIGWVLHERSRGQGYATEAARARLDYGFTTLGLHRVIATCQPENVASWRVMERLGMRREAHFRQSIPRNDGTWWDEYVYAILLAEWNAMRGD
jgi:RimJ/RimL family protein N-acetyltransferase